MSRLADPKILMAINNLHLAAKATVDGFLNGINRSALKGEGIEFSQYRSYQPGDDLRRLDWKLAARSDRYYIRESEEETNITIRFLVDCSASMDHQDGDMKKIDYARYLAACLGYLASRQHDAFGLTLFPANTQFNLSPGRDSQHLARLFFHLESIRAAGKFLPNASYNELTGGRRKKELLVFITDMHEQEKEIGNLLETLVAMKHEIIVFQLMGNNELEFDYEGYSALEDLETGEIIKIDPSQNNSTYKKRVQEYLSGIRTHLLGKNIFYRLININEPPDQALRDFLNGRHKLKA